MEDTRPNAVTIGKARDEKEYFIVSDFEQRMEDNNICHPMTVCDSLSAVAEVTRTTNTKYIADRYDEAIKYGLKSFQIGSDKSMNSSWLITRCRMNRFFRKKK